MTVFADSSALVKRYADEPGADDVRALALVVVSALARVEVPAALWRKTRAGGLAVEDAAVLVAAFAADCADAGQLVVLAVRAEVLTDAARLAATRALGAYGAVQLASARAAREADPEVTGFACYDVELRRAAAAEGFELVV